MVSFKGLLRNGKPAPADYVRCLQTTLAGISRYTVDGRDDELASFREKLLRLSAEIRENSDAGELEKIIGAALEHLRAFNERAAKLNTGYAEELKSALRTMTETITFLSESRTRSVHQLQFVEREMEQAVQLDDIRLLRARLTTCLEAVRDETVRLQTESATRTEQVGEQIKQQTTFTPTAGTRFGSMDSVTGLPSRRLAEKAITESLAGTQTSAIALIVVNRLVGINARYGREIGDEVMLRISNHFAQHLSSSTSLYRWSGPALVALTHVHGNFEELKAAWTKTAMVKHELSLDSSQRSVFVKVETSINFFSTESSLSATEVFRALDQTVAGYTDADTFSK